MGDYTKDPINILVIIVSCSKNKHLWQSITDRLKQNFIILCGDAKETILISNILYLNCIDTYDGLSEKMMLAYKFIVTSDKFNGITHIFKADDHDTYFTIEQIKDIEHNYTDILKSQDYIGQNLIRENQMGRTHHFNKVPISSKWHNTPYLGKYIPYLGGGETYILSIKSLNYIVVNNLEYTKYGSYEDIMIGSILSKYNIQPYICNYNIKTWCG